MDELISVVVSTYNWPEALDLSLKSLSAQTDSNFEIIVADDGSGCETARVVEEWCRKSPVKVIHSWQEDKGFRLARSRNVAVTRSAGKYLIFMDGDCIVRSDFVAMHRMLAERHSVLAGQRILLAEAFSKECLISGNLAWCESISKLRELARNRAVNRWQSAVSLPLGFFSMKAGTLENKKEKTPPVRYSIPMLMRHYCGLAQPASPIVCADSGLRAIPGVNQVMP